MVILTPVLSPHHLLGAAYELLKDHVLAYYSIPLHRYLRSANSRAALA